MNSDWHVQVILEPFFKELTDEERQYGFVQQDGATAYTADTQREHYERCSMTESSVQDIASKIT
jgi:hypothetical protein